MNTQPKSRALVWFRNDLRVHDHEVLIKAASKTKELIPIYCFDIRQFKQTFLGFPKTDSFRAGFMIESVKNLRENLRKIGSDLIVRVGIPEEIIPDLAKHLQVSSVYCSQETTDEEIKVETKLENNLWNHKIPLETCWVSTLYHPQDIPFPVLNLPDTFTQFRKALEAGTQVRATLPIPDDLSPLKGIPPGDIPKLSDFGLQDYKTDLRAVLHFEGGETAALNRLKEYIWQKDLLKNYKKTRDELLGGDYSSKFSPWLALGCLSPRRIYEEVRKYESLVTRNQSTYWLIFELMWRDYFRFVARKYGNRIFQLQGIKNQTELHLRENHLYFEKWTQGKTGVSFIDANMKELNQTGFMSNRGRQNVASFLVKDLKINWIWGAMYFESKLIDYDVCSNWGNWTYVAGVGNDPRENRYFNIESQAKKYDAQGEYVKYWLGN
ncbi:MAG: DASH family cryptochrome [Microscillaceae bacterium]|nr:DASH family cryptochrome [Microscillaceae bacterium]